MQPLKKLHKEKTIPSSPNYKRDYKKEQATATSRGEDKDRAQRNKARRQMEAKGKVTKGDGKDVDHTKMMKSGGTTSAGNLRVVDKSINRSRNGHVKGK